MPFRKPAGAGCTDQPAVIDRFQIKKYIDGLVSFIQCCNTPMTIAIQGDWGTGKTSVMQMVQAELKKAGGVQDVWFNTWQFSQFEMGDRLPLMLMSKLLRKVGGDKPDVKGVMTAVMGVLGDLAISYLSQGTTNAETAKAAKDGLRDTVDRIDKLKENFQELINAQAGENGRVVVFVDDLDRLQPGKAVELLEVLKIFLDCEKCVFVLAIDYSVVSRGVKEKYGEDFSDAKGRSFFDKIIQVPFKMPVASYDIESYVEDNLAQIGVTVRDKDQLKVFVALIESSIGNNPRSMKRLFNSFLLLRGIADDSVTADPHNEEILFALLCMQSRYEAAYNYLMKHRDNKAIQELVDCLNGDEGSDGDDDEETKDPFFTKAGMGGEKQKDERESFLNFGQVFYRVIHEGEGGVTPKELKTFQGVLAFSSITSTDSAGDTGAKGRGSEVVDDVDGLKMKYRTLEERRAMCDWIRGAVPEAHIKMVNANSGYSFIAVQSGETGKRIAEIEELRMGWKLYYKMPKKLRDANPRLTALAEELGCEIDDGSRVTLKTPAQISDERAAKLLRSLYDLAVGKEVS